MCCKLEEEQQLKLASFMYASRYDTFSNPSYNKLVENKHFFHFKNLMACFPQKNALVFKLGY